MISRWFDFNDNTGTYPCPTRLNPSGQPHTKPAAVGVHPKLHGAPPQPPPPTPAKEDGQCSLIQTSGSSKMFQIMLSQLTGKCSTDDARFWWSIKSFVSLRRKVLITGIFIFAQHNLMIATTSFRSWQNVGSYEVNTAFYEPSLFMTIYIQHYSVQHGSYSYELVVVHVWRKLSQDPSSLLWNARHWTFISQWP